MPLVTHARRLLLPALIIAFLVASAPETHAQSVLNGSFETNTAVGTEFNLTDSQLAATVANTAGFSTTNAGNGEIDLVTGADFGPAPIFGDWKLTLHRDFGTTDAFSLALSTPLTTGATYNLSFWTALTDIFPTNVEVGVSSSATDFGDLIFAGAPSGTGAWTNLGMTFIAPSASSFLTVRLGAQALDATISVDNFTLVPVNSPEPASLLLLSLGTAAGAVVPRRGSKAIQLSLFDRKSG